MRGTGQRLRRLRHTPRFIPARAGNGPGGGLCLTPPPVHPRACGERDGRRVQLRAALGSSPRVRGTVLGNHDRNGGRRFIPARAGNGAVCNRESRLQPVHPRACGERPDTLRNWDCGSGSSPRVRGTGLPAMASLRSVRFIPARAGNGPRRSKTPTASSVHPRACGERKGTETGWPP